MSRRIPWLTTAILVAITAILAVVHAVRPWEGSPPTGAGACQVWSTTDEESCGNECDDSTPAADFARPAGFALLTASFSGRCPSPRLSAGVVTAPYHPPSLNE